LGLASPSLVVFVVVFVAGPFRRCAFLLVARRKLSPFISRIWRALGVVLKMASGEHHLRRKGRAADPEHIVGSLPEALAIGRQMAENAPRALPPMGPTWRKKFTMYAKIRNHNTKLAARRGYRTK